MRLWEQELQGLAQTLRSLEGERAALEGELASLRERAAGASAHRTGLQTELGDAERRRDHAVERAGFLSHEAKRVSADAERAPGTSSPRLANRKRCIAPTAGGPRKHWPR